MTKPKQRPKIVDARSVPVELMRVGMLGPEMLGPAIPPEMPPLPQVVAPPLLRIPGSALPYWQVVLDGVKEAEQELAEVERLEQQIARLKTSATARIGAYESYAGHLFESLKLDAALDRIDADGMIDRSGPSTNGTA